MLKRRLRILLIAVASVLAGGGVGVCGADTDSRSETKNMSDDDLRVRGVFDSDLPGIEKKHSLKLILHPHFGDLTKYDYMRISMGLNYAISSRFEVRGETEAYFANGLGDASLFSEAGFGEVKFTGKYRIGDGWWPGWDTAVGGSYSTPINHPPVDVTDGFEHRKVFATFAHELTENPDIRIFWGLGFDFVSNTGTPGRHDKNELRDNNQYISGGFVWKKGPVNYTLEAKYSTTRLLGDTGEDVFGIRPGFVWKLPRGERFNRRGRWVLGASVSTEYGPDGLDFGVGARLKMDLDLKHLFGRHVDDVVEK